MTQGPARVVEQGAHILTCTEAQVRLSRRVTYLAWQHVAASLRRIHRWRPIAGGSENTLRGAIRAQLASGALPRIAGNAWAATAQGDHLCACCGKIIRASGPEYEVGGLDGVYAHIECFSIWLAESNAGVKPTV